MSSCNLFWYTWPIMAGTWITDMQHFVGVDDPELDVPARARKMGQYLGRIVSAATSCNLEQPLESVISCRRRPGNRSCPGHIRLVRNLDDTIEWQCSDCGENGMIHGWQGTPWDLSGPKQVFEIIAVVPAEGYQAVAGIPKLPRPALRVVMRAAVEGEDVLLTGPRAEIDSLRSVVEKTGKRARARRELFVKLLHSLDDAAGGEDGQREGGPPRPSQKLSDTLVAFAEPLLQVTGPKTPIAMVRNALEMAMIAWNAVVLNEWGKPGDFLAFVRKTISSEDAELVPFFDMLAERKKRFFSGDLRGIGDIKVTRKRNGDLQVKVEERALETFRPIH